MGSGASKRAGEEHDSNDAAQQQQQQQQQASPLRRRAATNRQPATAPKHADAVPDSNRGHHQPPQQDARTTTTATAATAAATAAAVAGRNGLRPVLRCHDGVFAQDRLVVSPDTFEVRVEWEQCPSHVIKEVEMVQGTAVAVEGGVHLTLDTDTGPSSHDSPSTIQLLCLDRDLRLGLFAPG